MNLNFEFKSTDHIRYENGKHVSGPHGGAGRVIKVESNINGKEGYSVSIYNLDGIHPLWRNNLQMGAKQMKIIHNTGDKVILRGFGLDDLGFSFSDYGITIHFINSIVTKCVLHMHDRNVDIVYFKEEQNAYFHKKQNTGLKPEKEIPTLKTNKRFESKGIKHDIPPMSTPPKKQPELINSDNIPDASAVHKKSVKKTEPVNRKSIGLELFMFFFVATCIFVFLFFKEIKGFFQQTFIGETLETAETTDPIDPLQSFNWIGSPGKQTHFRNGDAIIEVWSKQEWDSLCRSKVPAFCHVENKREYDEMYGLLYNWWAISDPRNICPEGYHLPTKEDLLSLDSNTLFNQNRSELLTHFPGYKNENGYFKGKEELLTVWFNQSRYTGCYEACIVSNDNMKFDCYAANNAYSILFIPD